MAMTILLAIGVIYLIIGFILASIYVALDNGLAMAGGGAGPLIWTGLMIGWLPAILYYIFKLFGPFFLALLAYPFRRR